MNRKVTMKDEYIVGAEKSLGEIIKDIDLIPFFRSAVETGVSYVMLEDARGDVLYHYGKPSGEGMITVKKPVYLEGEAAGYIVIRGDKLSKGRIEAAAELILTAVNTILKSGFKTMLATETHMAVVNQSYNELLETNRRLKLSEGRYRDLADTLEKQVQERTEELRQALARLLHQEKIASVGQLAAGVAHEINNPLGFIVSNINTLNQYVSRFRDMLTLYRSAFETGEFTDERRELTRRKWGEYKLDFILSDAVELIKESLDGAERVRKIVADLKDFSHIDDGDRAGVDINREIDRTLNVLTHEIPGDAEIIRDYHPLPEFTCSPAHICQAFFNIILNALQTGKEGLKLIITTRYEKD
ncbi:MAG: histidine kinase, partial [Deferribacteres bacterium]|nr:histidine kinase [Deferribacteres bacterium]